MLFIYVDNITFLEIVHGLVEALAHHHIVATITDQIKSDNVMDLYIIFGMNDFHSPIRPNNYIVYQLEQTTAMEQSKWFSPTYLDHLKNAIEIWDYSLVNYRNLRALGLEKIRYVPLQYMACVNRCGGNESIGEKPIDFLFYGTLNSHRQQLIDQLLVNGLKVVAKSNLWQRDRDHLITQSKIVINLHYYDDAILETARLSYLLSNQVIVISETSSDQILDKWHSKYMTLVAPNQLVKTCTEMITNYTQIVQQTSSRLLEYQQHPYHQVIPLESLHSYSFMCQPERIVEHEGPPHSLPEQNSETIMATPIVNSDDILEVEQEITNDRQLILKLPQLDHDQLPPVTIVTVTYNRKDLFPMAIRNWLLFDYPRDRLEWIIVDDSDDGNSLSSLLPKGDSHIRYDRLRTTGRLSIGCKRNYGVEHATHSIIVFMDDDDYYYPCSIYARVALLMKYPQYDLVGVTDLDIYDTVNDFSARCKSALISEASMGFRKSFWQEQHFPDQFSTLGEGYPFTRYRRHRIIKMPSCFNLIAMTHHTNYTQGSRSHDHFKNVIKKDSLMQTLDLSTQLFIANLFNKKTTQQCLDTTNK